VYRPFELYVGLRYLRASRGGGFVSFISFISILGIALGVAVLIVVLSVMNGFEKELRERILGLASHASITGFDGPLAEWRLVRDVARANPEVTAAAPYVEGQGLMLAGGNGPKGVLIRGVLPEEEGQVADVGRFMQRGTLDDLEAGAYGVVLGAVLAQALGVDVGDEVLLMVSQANVTPAGVVPRMRHFTVSGIFSAGMYEYDSGLVFMHMADAQALMRLRDAATGVRLRLLDLYQAAPVARDVALDLGGGFYITDWTRSHANFFRSIQLTKTVMFVILLLVVGVAAFNIVSTLVMIVKDKEGDIAILRTVGATPRAIMRVFIVQGGLIGVLGTAGGLALGAAIAANLQSLIEGLEALVHTRFLDPSVYYLSELPAQIEGLDLLRICGTALVLSFASTLYPAWRAARTRPAEVLRYE
jgi:lipoprotein-releasing system permease protein